MRFLPGDMATVLQYSILRHVVPRKWTSYCYNGYSIVGTEDTCLIVGSHNKNGSNWYYVLVDQRLAGWVHHIDLCAPVRNQQQ